MRRRCLAGLGIAAIAVAATASNGSRADRDLAKALAGRTAGPAQRCVSASQVGNAAIFGRTLLYRDGRTVWRSDVPDCPALDTDPILVIELYGDQLCANDRFRTLIRGGPSIPGPSCRFGPFVPYRTPR